MSEPLQANFNKLVASININEGVTTKLQQLEQSAYSAAQSLQIISSMAESLSKSSLELNGSINTEVIKNINNLNNSIIDIQKNIQKTDKMVLDRKEILKNENLTNKNFFESFKSIFNFYRE